MLDSRSLDVISNFKLALLTRSRNGPARTALPVSNRGKKLPPIGAKSNALTSKVVEYDGTNHLVLTNDVIQRSNYNNKRRWLDYYRAEYGGKEESYDLSSESDEESETEDENPLKRLCLSEILAPLSHPSELATHPAISKTYKLPCLAALASDLIALIEVEQNTLNHLNKLLQVLSGEDWFYQLDENMEIPAYDHGLDESANKKAEVERVEEELATKETQIHVDNGGDDDQNGQSEFKRITRTASAAPEGQIQVTDPFFALPKTLALFEAQQQKQLEEDEEFDEMEGIQQDLVNYLQVSIQRQHEYIANLTTIRNGTVKADRYKSDLLRWGREMGEKK